MGKGKTVRYWPKNFAWEIATHRSSCQDRGARRGPCGAGAGSSLRSEGDARQKKQGRWHRCGSRRAKRTHPRHALVCEQDWGTVSRNRDGRKRAMRASGRNAHGTRCSRRTSKCISSHSTTTPSILVNGSAADVCHSCGDCGRERGESGEQRAPGTARAARTPGGPADLQDQVVQRVADAVVLAVERIREVVCAEGRRAVSTQTAANFSRRQIETRRAQVAAWCSL